MAGLACIRQVSRDTANKLERKNLGANAFSDFWRRCVLRESARDKCIMNAILALGSLDRARKCDPLAASTPLFTALPSPSRHRVRASIPDHYPQALSLYAKALGEFRRRVALAFEHLHGNTEAVDKLTSKALALLKNEAVLPSHSGWDAGSDSIPDQGLAPTIAADLDDDGVRVAEMLLERMVSLNALYTPLYPRCNALTHARIIATKKESKPGRYSLSYLDKHSTLSEIESAWMSFLTAFGTWIQDAHQAGLKAYASKVAIDDELLTEQAHYKDQLEFFLDVVRQRLEKNAPILQAEARNGLDLPEHLEAKMLTAGLTDAERFTLERILIAAQTGYITISSSTDPTASTWDTFKSTILDVLDRVSGVLDSLSPEARESGVLYDDILGVSAHLAIESRDYDVRRKAMARWARMLSPRSSWENKSCFMAATALISVEEAGRLSGNASYADTATEGSRHADSDAEVDVDFTSREASGNPTAAKEASGHGVIPIEAQYKWIGGIWDESYTTYTVILRSKVRAGMVANGADPGAAEEDTKIVLDLGDFHFGGNGNESLQAVERLQRYLACDSPVRGMVTLGESQILRGHSALLDGGAMASIDPGTLVSRLEGRRAARRNGEFGFENAPKRGCLWSIPPRRAMGSQMKLSIEQWRTGQVFSCSSNGTARAKQGSSTFSRSQSSAWTVAHRPSKVVLRHKLREKHSSIQPPRNAPSSRNSDTHDVTMDSRLRMHRRCIAGPDSVGSTTTGTPNCDCPSDPRARPTGTHPCNPWPAFSRAWQPWPDVLDLQPGSRSPMLASQGSSPVPGQIGSSSIDHGHRACRPAASTNTASRPADTAHPPAARLDKPVHWDHRSMLVRALVRGIGHRPRIVTLRRTMGEIVGQNWPPWRLHQVPGKQV
ncbi:uncharacterized protein B0I36DRAFT_347875 [Microdochium trichocladiopsis]|uniref:Uncharacterized protein n=1 Tax=Microdochium trichocladiopsis TaxID=1682393 RepID=A0A9P9BRD8_9PEZI|nr:uncharacterized protein B0I36DRAFT_347875 [Microdochium trichocladiopsis]KAH7032695.1 hypothetical protein B0I36DRAFT_347875 [Microdochium trichocladiopsis]